MTSAKRCFNCLRVSQVAASSDLCQMLESRGLEGGDSWALSSTSGEVWRRRFCAVSSPTVNRGAAFAFQCMSVCPVCLCSALSTAFGVSVKEAAFRDGKLPLSMQDSSPRKLQLSLEADCSLCLRDMSQKNCA